MSDMPSKARSSNGSFPTTRWTIVRRLGDGESRVRFLAWDEFVAAYRRPLLLWLSARCRDENLAEELVQSFLVKIQSKEHAVRALDPARGRLRSWLLVSLQRHWIDQARRSGPATVGLEDTHAASPAPADALFDAEWAMSVARRALSRIREEYVARGSGELFDTLLKTLDAPGEEPRAAACARLGMAPNTFAVALMRFRERLCVRLREEVAATIIGDDAGEIDEELRHLIAVLSRGGGLSAALEAT